MNTIMNLCFLCTKNNNCVSVDNNIVSQVEYLLPEITIIKLGIPLRICSVCNMSLYTFNKFKQFCLESSRRLEASIKGALGPPQNPLPPNRVPQNRLHTDTNPDNTEETVVKKEKPEERQIQESCNSFLRNKLMEECSSPEHNTEGGSAALDTSATSIVKTEITKEIIIKEEHLEEPPEDINIYNMIQCTLKEEDEENTIKHNTDIKSATLNTSGTSNIKPNDKEICKNTLDENILTKPSIDTDETSETIPERTEQIFIKDEKIQETNHVQTYNQNPEMYNKFLNTDNNISSELEKAPEKEQRNSFGQKIFQCEVCSKSFTHKNNFNKHLKTHTGVKDFSCEICNKSFTQKGHLGYHMKSHSGIKDFKCTICNKPFSTKYKMKLHLKLHSGVKDFPCSVCEKVFSSQSRLNQHIKYHTGVRSFQCELCSKSFIQKAHFDYHMKVHSGVKDFPCSVCNKAFACRSALNQHMKIHV